MLSSPEEMEVLIAASCMKKVEDRVAGGVGWLESSGSCDVESHAILSSLDLVEKQLPEGGRGKSLRWLTWGPML